MENNSKMIRFFSMKVNPKYLFEDKAGVSVLANAVDYMTEEERIDFFGISAEISSLIIHFLENEVEDNVELLNEKNDFVLIDVIMPYESLYSMRKDLNIFASSLPYMDDETRDVLTDLVHKASEIVLGATLKSMIEGK